VFSYSGLILKSPPYVVKLDDQRIGLSVWWNYILHQWFSNFVSLQIPFTAPKIAADPFVLSSFFRLLRNYRLGRFLG